jgi:hypothetical protein
MSSTPFERRAEPRFQIQAPLEYRSPSATGHGRTRNISLSGVYIEAPPELAPHDAVEVRFSFFVGSFDIPFPGEVVRLGPDGFAARFGALGDAQLRILRRALPELNPQEVRRPTDAEKRREGENAIVEWLAAVFPAYVIEPLRERFATTFCVHPREEPQQTAMLTVVKYLLEDEGGSIVEFLRFGRTQGTDVPIVEELRGQVSVRVERDDRGVLVAVQMRPAEG